MQSSVGRLCEKRKRERNDDVKGREAIRHKRILSRNGAVWHSPTVNLLNQLSKLASNVGGVAIQDGGVTSTDLTGVVEDNDLGVERSGLLGGVVLGVTTDVSSTDVLDG